MKALPVIFAFLLTGFAGFSQANTVTLVQKFSDCAPVTQRMIQANFSIRECMELEKDPRKLSKLNYVLAQSYRFADDQMVLRSQRQLFNVKAYESHRLQDYRVTVFDAATGLYVELFSWNEIDKQFSKIDLQYDMVSCK